MAAILFFGLILPASGESVGQIVYLEGIVDIHRDGEIIELFDSDVGMEIFNQDLISTGGDGILELELTAYANPGTIVKVAEKTAFYLDFSRHMGSPKTDLPLLAGSLSFKVQRLTGSEELNVRTQSAIAGVRGTEFEVVTAPEGSILVICSEGKVSCEDDQYNQQFAQAGRVVEKRSGETLRRIDVDPGDENLYRNFWINQREQVFKAGAQVFVKAYALQYQSYLAKFTEAYKKVASHRGVLELYGRDVQDYSSDLMLIYNEVSKDIIPSRGIFNLFEQIFYSLKTLQDYHLQGIGITDISRNLSSAEFFAEFRSYEPVLLGQLAEMHYYYKLFANIASSASPAGGSLMGDIFSGSNPLGGGMPQGSLGDTTF
jgi:hypothetical protein